MMVLLVCGSGFILISGVLLRTTDREISGVFLTFGAISLAIELVKMKGGAQ